MVGMVDQRSTPPSAAPTRYDWTRMGSSPNKASVDGRRGPPTIYLPAIAVCTVVPIGTPDRAHPIRICMVGHGHQRFIFRHRGADVVLIGTPEGVVTQ